MSVAPELPPVVRIPARAQRTSRVRSGEPRALRVVPGPRSRHAFDPATARPVRTGGRVVPAQPVRPAALADAPVGASQCAPATAAAVGCAPAAALDLLIDFDAPTRSGGRVVGSVGEGVDSGRLGARAPRAAAVGTTGACAADRAVRLTARGRVALALASVVVAAGLILLAWAGAPEPGPQRSGSGPATVVVHDGDTLWSIARQEAPGVDPRQEVARLRQLNHLQSSDLRPGQVLRVR